MNKEFDNIIKDKLGSFEEAPPAYMWDKIASGIPVATPTAFYKTSSFKIAAVAASIAVIIGLSWVYKANKQNSISKQEPIQLKEIQKTANIESISENSNITHYSDDKINKTNQKVEKINSKEIKSTNSNKEKTETQSIDLKSHKNSNIAKDTKTSYHNYSKNNNSFRLSKSEDVLNNEDVLITAAVLKGKEEKEVAAVRITKKENNEAIKEEAITIVEDVDNKIELEENSEEQLVVAINENSEEQSKSQETIEKPEEIIETKAVEVEEDSFDIAKQAEEVNNDNKLNKDFNPKTREFNKYGLGVHYGYEYVKLNDDNINIHNIDMSFNYRNLNFILQTGIGGQYSKDDRVYNLEYKRNEYLTTEIRFDSAQFVIDSTGTPQLVPVNPYYTDVYDSVNYMQSDNFTESYYSLRIPLMIGYQKDFGRFGGFIKGGFIYSVLITKNRSEVYSLDESSRLVMLQYSGSKRVDSQIQYVMSGGLVFRINKKLHFQTEIMGKYYQSSIYDNPIYDNIKPWSIEGRVGLVYFLN